VAVTLDDDVKLYKPSGGERGRWSRLVEALPTDWERVELQDKDGAVLWGIDTPREVTAAPGQLGKGGVTGEVGALVRIMLQAQDMALARQGELVSKLTAGYERLAETLTGRLTSLEQMVSTCLQSVYDATLVAGEAHAMLRQQGEGAPGGKAQELLAQLVGIKMGARVPAARPNGQRAAGPTPPVPPPEE